MGQMIMKGYEVLMYRNRLDSLVDNGDDILGKYIYWNHQRWGLFESTEYHYKKAAIPQAEDEILVKGRRMGGGDIFRIYFKALQMLTDLEQVIHRQRQRIGAERLWQETVRQMREWVFEDLKSCYLNMCKTGDHKVEWTGRASNLQEKKYYYPIKKQFSPQIDWEELIRFTGQLQAKCFAQEAENFEVWSEMTAEVSEDMAAAMEVLTEVDFRK